MKVLPTASLYDVLGDLIEDNALDVTTTTLSGNASDGLGYAVRTGTFASDDGSSLKLVLVNRDPTVAREVELSAMAGYVLIDGLILTADDALAESMQVASLILTPAQTSFSLPALSVMVLDFQAVPEPTLIALFPLAPVLLRRRRQ